MRAGYDEYLAIRERLNLPLLETGAVVVAWRDEELARLDESRRRRVRTASPMCAG